MVRMKGSFNHYCPWSFPITISVRACPPSYMILWHGILLPFFICHVIEKIKPLWHSSSRPCRQQSNNKCQSKFFLWKKIVKNRIIDNKSQLKNMKIATKNLWSQARRITIYPVHMSYLMPGKEWKGVVQYWRYFYVTLLLISCANSNTCLLNELDV